MLMARMLCMPHVAPRGNVNPIVTNQLIFNDHSLPSRSMSSLSNFDALVTQPHADRAAEASPDYEEVSVSLTGKQSVARGGVATPFPWKLHDMLESVDKDGFAHLVCWQPHGRAFMVKDVKTFVDQVMPIYFNQSKFASFQRQLNLYGFRRLTQGKDKGGYFHGCFLRGKRALCREMGRQKVKGTKVRQAIQAGLEPDLYRLPFIPLKPSDATGRTNDSRITTHGKDQSPSCCSPLSSKVNSPFTSVLSETPIDIEDIPPLFCEGDAKKSGDLLFFEGQPFHYLDSHNAAIGSVPMGTLFFSKQAA
jgi:hypothetical protein